MFLEAFPSQPEQQGRLEEMKAACADPLEKDDWLTLYVNSIASPPCRHYPNVFRLHKSVSNGMLKALEHCKFVVKFHPE
jgi:hypothetical protein